MAPLKTKIFFSSRLRERMSADPGFASQPGLRAARAFPNLLLDVALDPSRFGDAAYCRKLVGDAWECLCTSGPGGTDIVTAFRAASVVDVYLGLEPPAGEYIKVHVTFFVGRGLQEKQAPIHELAVKFRLQPRFVAHVAVKR